jgi:leader peptidase (prepilin peptidase)/N-methyltransferase
MLSALFAAYVALVGLVVGSYLNVVIFRLPRGLSTVLPRSRCTECGTVIRAFDNIPLLSYLILGGRCRVCRARISWRYPLIEALTGALFVLCFLRFGVAVETAVAAAFCTAMVALAAIDIEHYLLPDAITGPGIVLGIALQPFVDWARLGPGVRGALLGGVAGAALGAGILLSVWGAWYLLRREEGMGLGDVKMLAMIGAFLGWKGVLVSLFAAALSGALAGLLLMAWKGLGMKARLPFGAFLALGGLIALFAGPAIVASYASLL